MNTIKVVSQDVKSWPCRTAFHSDRLFLSPSHRLLAFNWIVSLKLAVVSLIYLTVKSKIFTFNSIITMVITTHQSSTKADILLIGIRFNMIPLCLTAVADYIAGASVTNTAKNMQWIEGKSLKNEDDICLTLKKKALIKRKSGRKSQSMTKTLNRIFTKQHYKQVPSTPIIYL